MPFLTVRYKETDSREYTYAYSDKAEPLPKPGDQVIVDARGRRLTATVVQVNVAEPSFFCKPITELLGPLGSAEESTPGLAADQEDDEIAF